MKVYKKERALHYLLVAPRTSPYPYPLNFELLSPVNQPCMPPGFGYISASMKSVSDKVYNLNLELEPGETEETIADAIATHKIDVVFTGGLSRHFSLIKQVVDAAKKADPHITIIVGGGVVSSAPSVAMTAFGYADVGVVGEGERTVQELMDALDNGKDLHSIRGIILKGQDEYIETPPREVTMDLDQLPFPDYEGLGCEKFLKHNLGFSIICGRSCPFNCTFCFHPAGRKYRQRSVDNIVNEIEWLINKYGGRSYGLIGEGLFFNKNKGMQFLEKIKPLDISWLCTIHASCCDEELLRLMKESGCSGVCIGIESACDHILKSMNKKTSFKTIEQALNMIQSSGIPIIASNFIFGDSQEDMESIETTLGWWRQHRNYPIDLQMIRIYPGTAMYKQALQRGIIADEVEFLRNGCPLINQTKLTDYQYRELEMRLSTELAFYTKPPENYSIVTVDYEERKTTASYSCQCGYHGEIMVNGLLVSETFVCPACTRAHQIPFHECYSTSFARDTVDKLLIEHGSIAFWGIGIEMQLMLHKIDVSNIKGLVLVDADIKKQGLSFMGLPINSPDIITAENIPAVVLTPIAKKAANNNLEQNLKQMRVRDVVHFDTLLCFDSTLSQISGKDGNDLSAR